jgi:hypothetical protein
MDREEKLEIRNPKFETNSKHEIPMTQTLAPGESPVLNFGFWSFGFVSDFVLRISDFRAPPAPDFGFRISNLIFGEFA